MKKVLTASLVLVFGFGMMLALAGPNAGPANYVTPVAIVPPPVNYTAPAAYDVPATNSTMIAPPRNLDNAAAWTNAALYKNGDVVKVDTRFYWNCALVYTPSPSTTGPTSIAGDTTDGSNVWRRVYQTPRLGIDVTSQTGYATWLSLGSAAKTNAGIYLQTAGSSWSVTGPWFQGPVYAITTNTVHLNVMER